jgi:hypothetical protein
VNQRRQQLERDLPEHSKYLCDFLWKYLNEAGVSLPANDIAFIGKLVSAFAQTAQGKKTLLHMLKAEPKPASTLRTYFKAGHRGDESQKIAPHDLMEFRGWIYKGTAAIRWDAIEVDEREDATMCDACGGRFPADYCTRKIDVVKRTGEVRSETWCNHCRMSSEDQRIRVTSDDRTCSGCEKVICEFHPRHVAATSVARVPSPQIVGGLALPPGWERP